MATQGKQPTKNAPPKQPLPSSAARQRHQRANAEATANRPKILRIGVILGDRIVEERLIRDHGPVTIGQSSRNTFAVPTAEMPRSFTLFQTINASYALNFAETMDGRLVDGNSQPMTFGQLKQTGKAVKNGNVWQLPVTDNARGKIIIGEMTLLFQFVAAPPLQPRPQLPHSVRGTLLERVDPYLAIILLVSLASHSAMYAYFKWIRDEKKEDITTIYKEYKMDLKDLMPTPPKPKVEPPKVATASSASGDEKKPDDDKGKPKDPPKQKTQAELASEVAQAAPIRVFKMAGSKGSSGNGTIVDVTAGKDAFGDLDKGLNKVGQTGVALSTTGTNGVHGQGPGGLAQEGTKTGVTGPGNTGPAAGPKSEAEIPATGEQQKIADIDSGGLDPDKVAQTVRNSYFPSVIACYQQELKGNPTLQGKLALTFTIGKSGSVTSAQADFSNGNVAGCVERAAKSRWRFSPKPAEEATFQISFVLRPGH